MKAINILVLLLLALPLGAQTNELIPVLICGDQSFTNARITQTSPAYAIVSYPGGIAQVAMSNLPAAYQQRYGYNPTNAEKYLAEKKQRELAARERQAASAKSEAMPAGAVQTIELTGILDETTYGGIPLCSVSGGHAPGKILVKNMPGPVSDFLHRYQKLKADIDAEETAPVNVTATATRRGPNHAARAAERAANRATREAKGERKVEVKQLRRQLSEMEKSRGQNASVRAYPTGQSWSGYEIWVCTGTP